MEVRKLVCDYTNNEVANKQGILCLRVKILHTIETVDAIKRMSFIYRLVYVLQEISNTNKLPNS